MAAQAETDQAGAPVAVCEPGVAPAGAVVPVARGAGALPWASLIVVYIVWGSTYLGIRVAIESIPPMLMAGVRFVIGGAIVLSVALLTGDRRGDRIRAVHWRSALIIGACLLVGGNALVGEAETRLPSGIAALLVATVPLWFAGLDRVVYGARIRLATIGGVLLGLAGAVVLVKPTSASHLDLIGCAVLVCATASWAIGSLYSRDAVLPRRPFVASGMEMVAGGSMAIGVGLLLGEWRSFHLAAVSTRSIVALVYLIVAGSLLAYTAYQYALRTLPTSTVTTYAYVNPVIAVFLGATFLGESVDMTTIMAAALMLAGVFVVLRHPSRRRAPSD